MRLSYTPPWARSILSDAIRSGLRLTLRFWFSHLPSVYIFGDQIRVRDI